MNDFTKEELKYTQNALAEYISRRSVFNMPIDNLLDLFHKIDSMIEKMNECNDV